MAKTRTQANRTMGVTTPLGDDALLLRAFTYTESLGRLFQAQLSLSSDEDTPAEFDKILGHPVSVRLEQPGGSQRFFHGFVSRFGTGGTVGRTVMYQALVVPWLWFLTRTSDCRIFQNMTVPDIIKQVFKDRGFTDYEFSLSGDYQTWEYCVQYRETDFNFVSRLMEQEGIYYYFEHTESKHTMYLTDSASSHQPFPEYDEIRYRPVTGDSDRGFITDWGVDQQVQPCKYAMRDFDFKAPRKDLTAFTPVTREHGGANYELYDYPGEYDQPGEGKSYTKVRLDELQSQYEVANGSSDATGISAGFTFSMTEHPREDQNREYLITSASYHVSGDEFDSGGGGGGPTVSCHFNAIPAKQQFRPARQTPKPLIQGPQTAIVVGPGGEEIHTDEFGRVKVHFHWDRHDKSDEKSSCWIRVSQPWAGKAWGGITIPRIGQEVVVEFLEGDPDQPLITGRVYNADMPVPYALPANKTQSGMKSRSSPNGSPANFNEIRMEDKKGSEQLYIHAEKNEDIVVENDKTEQVGHDEMIKVGHDSSIDIGNDRTLHVHRDKTETVDRHKVVQVLQNHTETISGAMSITVAKTLTEMVGINYAETVGGAMELTVGAALAITVGAVMSETVAGAKTESVGGSSSEAVGSNRSLSVGGNVTETIKKDRKVTIEKDLTEEVKGKHEETVKKEYILHAKKVQLVAEDEISFKTGSAEIIMKKNGDITINGNKITVKGSGDVILKGSKVTAN